MAGTQEPIYGPSAIKTVAQEAEEANTPYTELGRDDFKWVDMDSTNVETETFYLFSKEGHICLAQVIYSNVAYAIPLASLASLVPGCPGDLPAFK